MRAILKNIKIGHKIMGLFALTLMVIVMVVLTGIPRINKTMIEGARQDLKLMNTLVCIMAEALFVEDSQLVDQISENQIMAWVQVSKAKDFIVYYSPGMNMIRFGDPLRIGQILTNLANNAVKFTEQGEVGINIEQAEGELIRFQVRDTGIGLSPEQQSRLFQSFSQADTSTTLKYGGTGLGLAISKQLVTLMGGRIWVESEAGIGSSFIFELPLEEKQGARAREKIFKGKRVLVVDDTRSWQQVLVSLLRYYGMEPDVAESGEEAVALLCRDNRQYDLVFMD